MNTARLKGAVAVVLVATAWMARAFDVPPAPESPRPKLVFESTDLDLGAVVPGQRVTQVVRLRNAGNALLEIPLVRASSPRLNAHLSATSVPPGDKTELRISFTSGAWEEGPFTEAILLYPDDPLGPLAKVKLRGVLQPPIKWHPKIIMGVFHRNDPKPLPAVRLSSLDGAPLGPLRVNSFVPYLKVKAIPEASGIYRLELTLDPAISIGPLLGWLRVETSHPKLPLLDVPVHSRVAGALDAHPLDFGLVEEGRPTTGETTLQNLGSREVQLVKATPHVPTAAEVSFIREGKNHRVRVRLPSPSGLQDLKGHINLYTDDPVQPVVQVPVTGAVWSKKPFERGAASGDDGRLYPLIRAALFTDKSKLSDNDFLANILGGIRDHRAVSVVLKGLEDENWLVRERAAKILGLLHSVEAVTPIRNAVTHDMDEDVRRAAAEALVRIAGKEALPEVLLALQDNDAWVRADAARLLGELGDSRAVPILTQALSDEDEEVRTEARGSLGKFTARR